MFNHVELNLPQLDRETIDGVRYYKVPDNEELLRLVSITSVTSHKNRDFFAKWRKRVGEEEANKITRQATSRGTDTHTLTEFYLKNLDCTSNVLPISEILFQISKPELNKINNIHALESSLYSKQLGIAHVPFKNNNAKINCNEKLFFFSYLFINPSKGFAHTINQWFRHFPSHFFSV
jgi:genome maintenance exonuclease 1